MGCRLGGQMIQRFLKEGLIDDLILTTIPILLGGGIPLFSRFHGQWSLSVWSHKVTWIRSPKTDLSERVKKLLVLIQLTFLLLGSMDLFFL